MVLGIDQIDTLIERLVSVVQEELVKILPGHVAKYVPEAISKLHLSLQDVAGLTEVSYQRIHQLVETGDLKVQKVNGHGIRVCLGDLFSFLNEREQNPRVKITRTAHGERWDLPVRGGR
jgi:hypothetical protein